MKKKYKQQEDRLLKQLNLADRRQQERIRRRIEIENILRLTI